MVTSPLTMPRNLSISPRSRAKSCSVLRAWRSTRRPVSVSRIPSGWRSNSGVPRWSSSFRICRLTAEAGDMEALRGTADRSEFSYRLEVTQHHRMHTASAPICVPSGHDRGGPGPCDIPGQDHPAGPSQSRHYRRTRALTATKSAECGGRSSSYQIASTGQNRDADRAVDCISSGLDVVHSSRLRRCQSDRTDFGADTILDVDAGLGDDIGS